MNRILVSRMVVMAFLALALRSGPALATSPPQEGGALPEMDLSMPSDPVHASYLGLSCQGLFQIPQIKAEAVIIQIFSMY